MKLLFFNDERLGLLTEGGVVDADAVLAEVKGFPQQAKLEHLIENYSRYEPELRSVLASGHPVAQPDLTVLPPVSRPRSTLCAFTNYRDRVDGFEQPPLDFFYKGSAALLGHGGTVRLPDIPDALVFQPEPELGYVIGSKVRNVKPAAALDHVFGYVNFVDVSARKIPGRRTTFLPKGLETWAPVGPVIVTKDEIADPHNLRVRLWINGELCQDYNTGLMAHDIPAQMAWLSQYITLTPGDVVACGTHHQGLSPINEGDFFEMEIERLERLSARVKSDGPVKTAHWRPPHVKPEAERAHK